MRSVLLATGILAWFCAVAAAAPEPLTVQQILGAHIVAANGARVGEVTDLLCDTSHGRIADLIASQGDARIAIPWTPLSPSAPAPIRISATALAQSAPVGQALNSNPSLHRVMRDLVGRAVISADGAPAGRIVGLRIDPQSGAVADIIVSAAASARAAKELPWTAIANIDLSPIVLDLDSQQIAASPAAGDAQTASY